MLFLSTVCDAIQNESTEVQTSPMLVVPNSYLVVYMHVNGAKRYQNM